MAADTEREEHEKAIKRQQRRRSIAIALGLLGLVVLFYVMTIVRLGGTP
ncbi:MAG: hypothetical protein U1E49_17005 [Hyphomicrobiaceae bacterium]